MIDEKYDINTDFTKNAHNFCMKLPNFQIALISSVANLYVILYYLISNVATFCFY